MSEQLYFYPAGSQPATVDYYSKQQQHQHQQLPVQQQPFDFDFASFGLDSSCPPVSQDLQEFENDLDSFLAQAIDVPVPFTGDPALFERFRADTPTRGVPSTFTVSSESLSAYESSLYNENESAYTYHSEASVLSDQFNMNLQTLAIDNDGSVYSLPSPMSNNSPNSNGGVNMAAYSPTAFSQRGSFSDYEPVRVRHTPASSASDYYPQQLSMKYSSPNMPTTVSPANVSSQLPNAQNQSPIVHSQQRVIKEESNLVTRSSTTKDSKRKYQCPNCPRGMFFIVRRHSRPKLMYRYSFRPCIQSQDPRPDT